VNHFYPSPSADNKIPTLQHGECHLPLKSCSSFFSFIPSSRVVLFKQQHFYMRFNYTSFRLIHRTHRHTKRNIRLVRTTAVTYNYGHHKRDLKMSPYIRYVLIERNNFRENVRVGSSLSHVHNDFQCVIPVVVVW